MKAEKSRVLLRKGVLEMWALRMPSKGERFKGCGLVFLHSMVDCLRTPRMLGQNAVRESFGKTRLKSESQ